MSTTRKIKQISQKELATHIVHGEEEGRAYAKRHFTKYYNLTDDQIEKRVQKIRESIREQQEKVPASELKRTGEIILGLAPKRPLIKFGDRQIKLTVSDQVVARWKDSETSRDHFVGTYGVTDEQANQIVDKVKAMDEMFMVNSSPRAFGYWYGGEVLRLQEEMDII